MVWKELQNIPYGKTRNYSEIAAAVGNKNAHRAVSLHLSQFVKNRYSPNLSANTG